MKLLFDKNVSVLLQDAVQSFFPESKHVASLELAHLSDHQIWRYAKENSFTIVTKDKDFYHLSTSAGQPPKVVWLTIGNRTNRELIELVLSAVEQITLFKGNKDILILP